MRFSIAICLLLALVAAPAAAQAPKYGVTVKADGKTDFTKLKTYAWEPGWKAPDKNVDAYVIAAVDRELATLGFEKKDSGPTDVFVKYATTRRTDVDLKSKPEQKTGMLRQYEVGTLVVLLLQPGTSKVLFQARGDKPIEIELEKVKGVIDAAVAEMFAKYPTRTRK